MVACGFETIDEVRAAGAALEFAARTQPDAIVLDIEMAGSRGVKIVAELLTAVPNCAVIVMSQFDSLRFPALEAGAYAFLGKADLRELRRSLSRIEEDPSSSPPYVDPPDTDGPLRQGPSNDS